MEALWLIRQLPGPKEKKPVALDYILNLLWFLSLIRQGEISQNSALIYPRRFSASASYQEQGHNPPLPWPGLLKNASLESS